MSDFQRSPSKVWWAMELQNANWPRAASASPGSQDSGFSDTETSPTVPQIVEDPQLTPNRLPRNILKDISFEANTPKRNFTSNFKEKYSPKKTLASKLTDESYNKSTYYITTLSTPKTCYIPRVQQHQSPVFEAKTEPIRKFRTAKGTPKVSRNLFSCTPVTSVQDVLSNQYSVRDKSHASKIQYSQSSSSEVSFEYNGSWEDDEEEDSRIPEHIRTLPLLASKRFDGVHNLSAPGALPDGQVFRDASTEGVTSFSTTHESSSDCESELELLFPGPLDSPKHTSTPKISVRKTPLMKQRIENRRAKNLLLKQERIIRTRSPTNSVSVQQWLNETRKNYEAECTITLQNKPIAEELNQRIGLLAGSITAPIRKLQSHIQLVEDEIQKITSEVNNSAPLRQSLAGLIVEFMTKFLNEPDVDIMKICENLKNCKTSTNIVNQLTKLFPKWQSIKTKSLDYEIRLLVNVLEDPKSEFQLRGTLTGITSITLHHPQLADLVVNSDGIRALLVLCEQCQGSSVRALTLRALSSICSTTTAVRLFEQASGIQIINDILCERPERPEPERSEATSLLALVTSPWIEDNQSVRGLSQYAETLIVSLTKFLDKTKCCLNLILCAAALANISGMESSSIRHLLKHRVVGTLLEAVRRRGPRAAVELLEQVATLLANMSAVEEARGQLTEDRAPSALLCFLQPGPNGNDAEKSLQQKAAIALSRLCGDLGASRQVVEMDGISRLVSLCRERSQRHDSDAVLVATLATLRKIAENCGCDVINTQDAQELVEPRLLDSFIAYSAQNESYV